MSQDDFISNDLVNMRERLRRNYEERQRSAAVEAEPQKKTEVPAANTAGTASVRPLPVLRREDADPETLREFRDLEGRLLRDLAASRTLAETIERRVRENEDFSTLSSALLKELQSIPEDDCTQSQLRSIRVRYMSALGRWNAQCGLTVKTEESSEKTASAESGKYWWLLSASLLISALIVAGTLFALWG